jgi:integrase
MKPVTMHSRVRAYLAHRRKLGFVLSRQAYHLRKFASFADKMGPGQPLTTALALRWAISVGHNRFGYHAMRYQSVRGLARYLAALDPRTEMPPARMLGSTCIRRQPHIYTPEQVRLMMKRARQLPHRTCYAALRSLTLDTMIGLVFCTGLRPAEVCKLRLADFDPRAHTMVITQTKFSPQRTLPLHSTVVRALESYQKARRRVIPFGDHFFVSRHGGAFTPKKFGYYFHLLIRGIEPNGARPMVRFGDLRHTFATRLISGWSRQGKPTPHYLALLSRYMGHKQFNATWWYVSPDCSSLKNAMQLFRRFQQNPTSNDSSL